jgi:hypothetical protein
MRVDAQTLNPKPQTTRSPVLEPQILNPVPLHPEPQWYTQRGPDSLRIFVRVWTRSPYGYYAPTSAGPAHCAPTGASEFEEGLGSEEGLSTDIRV